MLGVLVLVALLMPSKSATVKTPPAPVKIYPMVGSFAKYAVKKGDPYYKIARSHNVSRLILLQLYYRQVSISKFSVIRVANSLL